MRGYVIDTCVLLDIFEGVEPFATWSAEAIDSHFDDGLVIAPITYVELAPAFRGDLDDMDDFLRLLGVRIALDEPLPRIKSAARMWSQYVDMKRNGQATKRPMADLLIGTCATSYQGLITRNGIDFAPLFPTLVLIDPKRISN